MANNYNRAYDFVSDKSCRDSLFDNTVGKRCRFCWTYKKDAPKVIRTVGKCHCIGRSSGTENLAINDDALNAFTTGRDPSHFHTVLTKGTINKLEKPELEGV
jgi:hypothetical protein